jgi:AcrR family transcriptional regulator
MKRKNITTRMMKEYIAESLMLLMAKKAYDDISIKEITDKAGVNRSTYYRNFASKDSIVEFWFSGIMSEYMDDYSNSSDSSAENYLNTIFNCFYKHKKEFLLIHSNGLSHLILHTLNKIFEENTGNKKLPIMERYKRYFHTGGIYNFLVLWLSSGMKESPEMMVKAAISCFPSKIVPMLLART